MDISDIAEDACATVAERVVSAVAASRKTNAAHVAVSVPGLCHVHEPTTETVPGCAYCARRGNVFAPDGPSIDGSLPDIVAPRASAIRRELELLANDIVKILES